MRARIGVAILFLGFTGAALFIRSAPASAPPAVIRFEPGPSTSRNDLLRTVGAARTRLAAAPDDVAGAVALADALVRLARVESEPAHAVEAEQVLERALREVPGHYAALRTLGAVYLSRHRFRDALRAAQRAQAARPHDAWNYGVQGDAYVELGEYDRAFAAFDTMATLRPDAASYARVAYAHELQGRLEEAIASMRLAVEATSAHDPESLAWQHSQLGHLYLEAGDANAAAREYARANFVFPDYPYARAGLARVAAARGDRAEALRAYRVLFDEAPNPELAAAIGDLLMMGGDRGGASAMYGRAEALEREGWRSEEPQPAALATMLAERGLKTGEAVRLAEEAVRSRTDIFTMDALAIAYHRAGRLDEAAGAAARALRTGTRNRRIIYHAAAVAHARGRADEAMRLLARMPDGPIADPLLADRVAQLAAALARRT